MFISVWTRIVVVFLFAILWVFCCRLCRFYNYACCLGISWGKSITEIHNHVLFADSNEQSQQAIWWFIPEPIRKHLIQGFLCISSTASRNIRWFHLGRKVNARCSNFIFDHVHNFICHHYHRKGLTDRGFFSHSIWECQNNFKWISVLFPVNFEAFGQLIRG